MISRLIHTIWGDLEADDARKFGLLALVFFFIIGSYWMLRPLKEAIFFHTVGGDWQPIVKQVTIAFVFVLVLIYSKLVDLYHRHTLFYIIGAAYAVLFLGMWYFIGHPTIGVTNTVLSPTRYVGWASYIIIESFGYLMAAHFWSFVASSTDAAAAKRGYPMIVTIAQLGAFIASIVVAVNYIPMRASLLICIGAIGCIMLLIHRLVVAIPYEHRTAHLSCSVNQTHARKGLFEQLRSFVEGFVLLVTRPYLLGIFGLVLFYEIVGSIVDLQMLKQASLVPAYASAAGLTAFGGLFGICVNGMSFLFALVGTRYLIKKLGMVLCLLLFPCTLGIAMVTFWIVLKTMTLSASMVLWSLFAIFVLAKGLSYALNNPAKEMMYIPTSRDAQFKTKSWIDMFGARTAKAMGAQINTLLLAGGNNMFFVQMGTLVSVGCISIWLLVAFFVGTTFMRLTREGKIIE